MSCLIGGMRADHRRYTYSSIFATLIIEASSLCDFWGLPQIWQTLALYFFCPIMLLAINLCGVKVESRLAYIVSNMSANEPIVDLWVR
jgi:hypothetical protein